MSQDNDRSTQVEPQPPPSEIPSAVVALFETHIQPAYRWCGTAFYVGKKGKIPLSVTAVLADIGRKDPTLKPLLDSFRADLPLFIVRLAKKWKDDHCLAPTPLPDFVRKLFAVKFRWFGQPTGDRLIYYKVNGSPNTWKLMGNNPKPEQLVQVLASSLTYKILETYYFDNYQEIFGPSMAMESVPSFSDFITRQYKPFILDSTYQLSRQPVSITSDPAEPCFFYFDRALLVAGPHPGWDSFMAQMEASARSIFKAWIWSIFEPRNTSRQILWIFDDGYTGKSAVSRAISNIFKDGVVSLSHGAVDREWFFSTVYGHRLIIYGDNKNPNLLMTEKIHAVVGGDLVQIERKFEQAFTAPIYAKLLVCSNTYPEVNPNRRHETTRILFIPMTASQVGPHWTSDGRPCGFPEFQQQLESEIYYFLHTCQIDYNNLCPTHEDIVLPAPLFEAMINSITSQEYILFEEIFLQNFVVDPEGSVKCADVYRLMQERMARYNDFTYAHFKNYLEDVHKVRQQRLTEGNRDRVFRGIRYKNQQPASLMQSHKPLI